MMQWLNDAMVWAQLHSVIAVMTVFILIVAWAYWPSHKDAIERRGAIPLDDEP